MPDRTVLITKTREQGAQLFWRVSIGLNFLMLALEIVLFGFKPELAADLALAVSPWMGMAAVIYLGFQVGAVVMTDKLTRAGAAWDILFSFLITGYLLSMIFWGGVVAFNGSPWPWSWTFQADLFKADFIRCFGTAMVMELILILTLYIRYFQQQTEVSESPR